MSQTRSFTATAVATAVPVPVPVERAARPAASSQPVHSRTTRATTGARRPPRWPAYLVAALVLLVSMGALLAGPRLVTALEDGVGQVVLAPVIQPGPLPASLYR